MNKFGGVTDSLDLRGATIDDVSAVFAERIIGTQELRSVAEMRPISGDISWLNNWLSEHAKEIPHWMLSDEHVPGFSSRQMFGFLFLIFAAETAREASKEDSIWPSVCSALSDANGLRKKLFPQGQPSSSLKTSLEDGARRFLLRHVLDSEESYGYKYFDTVKLQFGFTLQGACNRLHEWLIGLGIPVSVRVLLGQEPKYPGLTSSSFQYTWDTLLRYRKGVISLNQAQDNLQNSPWVRPHWIDRLLRQATVKHEQTNRLVAGLEQQEASIVKLGLHWPHGAAPHLDLHVNRDHMAPLAARTTSHQLVFRVDGKPVERWLRQQDNSWSGKDCIPCALGTSTIPTLRPSQLTIATHEGEVLEETDLITLFELRRDVIIFDLGEGSILHGEDAWLNTRKEYALITNVDLILKGLPVVDWQRVDDAKIYRLTPPWPADVRLTLDDLDFWTPNIESTTGRSKVSLSLVALEDRPLQVGSITRLHVQDIPLETLTAELLLGSKTIELRQQGNSWYTAEQVEITPDLVLGLQKRRVELRDDRSRRTHPVRVGFDAVGTLVHERDMDSD